MSTHQDDYLWWADGLCMVMPANDPHRKEYVRTYLAMAKTLARHQQSDDYWTRSILDPAPTPGPETSGTAFFTYGYLWGINNGLLDCVTYLPVVRKSWTYLTHAVAQADATLGYGQPIGEKAIPRHKSWTLNPPPTSASGPSSPPPAKC
jgi:rhamnogalacturonyl hydrolase YesR